MRKINFRWIFFIFIAFCFGLVFSKPIFELQYIKIIFCLLVVVSILIICIKYHKIKRFFILFIVFLIGIFYFLGGQAVFYNQIETQNVVVNGRIANLYSYDTYNNLLLDNVSINGQKISFNISMRVSGEQNFNLGDIVLTQGNLTKTKLFDEYGFNSYYYKNDAPYQMTVSSSDLVKSDGYLKFDEKVRKYFNDFLASRVDKDMAGLITCVVFGDKSELDVGINNAYNLSGMSHLLAVSGMHITLIISFLTLILDKIPIKRIIKFSIFAIFLIIFTYLCDFAPSIVRSLIMGLLLSFSTVVGKKYDPLNSLGLCGLIILAFKPLYVFEPGFVLSFLCVFCIFTLTKPLTYLFRKLGDKISSNLAVVIGVQVGLIPAICLYSNSINIFCIFINMICVPVFEFAFMLTFFLVPICMIFNFLSFSLEIMQTIYYGVTYLANIVANISWANLNFPQSNSVLIFSFYSSVYLVSRYVNMQKILKGIIVCLILAVAFFFTFLLLL